MFAMQLADAIQEELGDTTSVDIDSWASISPETFFESSLQEEALYLLICSTTGVGEPPDNGRDFYKFVVQDKKNIALANNNNNNNNNNIKLHYCIFGLGNKVAHPNNFNAVAKNMDQALGEAGLLPLTLGDDAECIEDDFDQWQEKVLDLIRGKREGKMDEPLDTDNQIPKVVTEKTRQENKKHTDTAAVNPESEEKTILCPGAKSKSGRRRVSTKHQPLQLQSRFTSYVRPDLMEIAPQLYPPGCSQRQVLSNVSLNSDPASNGLHELRIALDKDMTYGNGDHFQIFPRNPDFMVDALCQVLDVDPHAVIVHHDDDRYPYPTKISVYETLSHCVDLSAVPSPSFCKKLLGRTDIDYKNEIAIPRKTVLELALSSMSPGQGSHLALEDWLYNLPPMQGRYYSIASSPLVHPNELFLTYRPVKYVTTQGSIRRGTCTSYMSGLTASMSHVVGAVRPNPSFRLPQDPATPIILIAGGCGVAPIRAFLEERIALAESSGNKDIFGNHNHHLLFLGFRNPDDAVYQDLVEHAKNIGAINKSFISYTSGCSSERCDQVTDAMRKYGQTLVYNSLTKEGGHMYVCGGARSFGAAVQNELLATFQKVGQMDHDSATQCLRDLLNEGRIHEDLSD